MQGMRTILLIVAVVLLGTAQGHARTERSLVLGSVQEIGDPLAYDLRDPVNGDRAVPSSCVLPNGTRVAVLLRGSPDGVRATLTVSGGGKPATVTIEDAGGVSRPTLACDTVRNQFYYGHALLGRLYAYASNGKRLWERQLSPFTALPRDGPSSAAMSSGVSVVTAVQARNGYVLAEWFRRDEGSYHAVYTHGGTRVGQIGPSTLLLRTVGQDEWWTLFYGDSVDPVYFIPKALYWLRIGAAAKGRSAQDVLRTLPAPGPAVRAAPVAKLETSSLNKHLIALLTPHPIARTAAIDFCSAVPAVRARYWLGPDYDPTVAEAARLLLLRFGEEAARPEGRENPLDAWFQREVAPQEPMKGVLARFNPTHEGWIADYQRALLQTAAPFFGRLADRFVEKIHEGKPEE